MLKTIPALALTALLALAAPARAALEVPEGQAAVIEAVLGKVTLVSDGKDLKPKVGMVLAFGDRLNTGSNGRVSLRHAGNAVSRLAPNTELSLLAPGAKKGTFMKLSSGLVRFLVGKRAPGESFEVETGNAVAAVKGTDAEVETNGKATRSSVFSSGNQKALEFLSAATGKSVFLAPGQSAGAGEGGFEPRSINPEEFARSKEQMAGLPEPDVEGSNEGGEEGNGSGEEGNGSSEQDANASESSNAFADAVSDAFGDLMADLNIDSLLERDERTGDTVAGRIAYDRNGDRTQISSWVVRADDTTIVKVNYSKRETGPFVGTTFAEEVTTWNAPLPSDWASIARNYLDSPQNLDGNGEPIWWRSTMHSRLGNPQGDLIEVIREYQRPYFAGEYDTVFSQSYLYYLMPQGFSQELWMTPAGGEAQAVQAVSWLADTSTYDTLRSLEYSNVHPLLASYPSSVDAYYSSTEDTGERFTFYYSLFLPVVPEDIFLSTDVRILTQEGAIISMGNSGVYYYPNDLRNFRGLNNAYSIELTFRSPLLSAPIDLLFIPEIFNHFDLFDMPGDEYYRQPDLTCECCECEA